jgi:hypothetical protein
LWYNVTWNIVKIGVAFDCIQTNKKAVLIVGAINTARSKIHLSRKLIVQFQNMVGRQYLKAGKPICMRTAIL